MPDLLAPMPDQRDGNSASSRLGPIQPDVPRAVAKGADPAYPELSAEHRDAQLARIADSVLSGEETSVGHGADRMTRPPTAALAPSSRLILREKHK